ncbi:uncharacterized protein LOC122973791 [Thunnus albacares]|uniref:uncharacterized protein LOC122973791 n=1 Tax=Thunnus albacares TaxID=8236 RepID=UPI001CF60F17|nr:uncharacterized protein LOC122973791 [Thunnus albacares]
MIPWKDLKIPGAQPWERFVTTYSGDYNPFSERHLQDNQLNHRTEAKPAPALISPPQTERETWPIFHQYLYKTTNSTYGSFSPPPSCSLHVISSPPFGILSPVSEATGVVGGTLTEARRETGPLLVKKGKGHLHYVFGGNANVLEQQEAKDELQQKVDVLYEEGVIVLSSHVVPACCESFLSCVCREAGLQHLLNLPVASSPIVKAGNWETSAYLRGLRQSVGLRDFLQPTCRRCSCCAWETECADRCCFEMQTFPPHIPQSSTLPLAPVQPTVYHAESSRTPLLTEYQASYGAEWAQPNIQQQSDFPHHHPPHHCVFHPSL